MNRERRGIRSAQAGLLTNAVLAVVKILAGVLGHSYALIADGVESVTDVFSSVILWRGMTLAARSPDQDYPFGYGKAETLSAAVIALMLLGAAVAIAIQAAREILTPHHAPAPFTLAVLVLVVVTKETLFRRVFAVGKEVDSMAVRADAWHHRSDAITSVAAFFGISVALLGGPGWEPADDFAALFASVIILFNGTRILQPAIQDLMDRAPDRDLLEEVSRIARSVEGVRQTEKILARRAGGRYRVVLHVQADPDLPLREAHDLGGRVRSRIVEGMPSVVDVLVHMEPFEG
ncbi:MAG: cation diffusion facilitator family transporter [Longimicrobiales bacterium]